jgi:hypothetical protein
LRESDNRRDEFFEALKRIYFDTTNENLPIYGVAVSKLKDYSTSKKDMKRGVEIVPEENYRLRGEDKFVPRKDFQGSGSSASPGSSGSFGSKGGSGTSTASSSSIGGGSDQFGDDYHPEHGFRDASQTLYAKKGDKKVSL